MRNMLRILFILLILVLLPYPKPHHTESSTATRLITAHRGSSLSAPENTMAAIRKAIADGADIVEIDVQMTSDGVVVLFHDETLGKIGLAGRVSETPFHVIANADAGSWYSPDYAGEPVPTLVQVLTETRGQIMLNIELKMTRPDFPLPEAVADLLINHDMVDSAIVTSFDRDAIRRVKAVNPSIRTGLIARSKLTPEDFWSDDHDVLSLKSKLIDRNTVNLAARAGKEIHVWTVNSEKEMKRMLKLGVASIITDDPETLRALIH